MYALTYAWHEENTQPTTSPPGNKMVMMMMMSEQINEGHHQRSKVITKRTSIFPVFLLISVAPYRPAPRLVWLSH